MGNLNEKYTTKNSGKVTTRTDNYGNRIIVSGTTTTIKTYNNSSGGSKPTVSRSSATTPAAPTPAAPTPAVKPKSYSPTGKVSVNKQIEVQPMFNNKFFSMAGQAARLKNVYDVLKIAVNPFSKDRINANIMNPTGKKALEMVANRPYTTAAIAATGITLVRALPAIGKAGVLRVGSKVAAKKTAAKVATSFTARNLMKAGLFGVGTIGGISVFKGVSNAISQGGLPGIRPPGSIEIPNPQDPSGQPIRIVSPAGAQPPNITYQYDPETGQQVPVIESPDIGYTPYNPGSTGGNIFTDLLSPKPGSMSLLLPAVILGAAIFFKNK